jgi:AraC-like DNA-binding protein
VERARRLLLEPDATVKCAALSAGFTSPEKFNQAFRDAWNLSPTAYRSLANGKPVDPGESGCGDGSALSAHG